MRVLRIGITGPESSGKSVLSEGLARHFGTSWAPEYARDYLVGKEGDYTLSDLDEICIGQIHNEEQAIREARNLCFFDTDMLVLKVWSEYRFGTLSSTLRKAMVERRYDLRLLCRPDLPWQPDPLRESPSHAERQELFDIYRRALLRAGEEFFVIGGRGDERLDAAVDAVETFVGGARG